MEDTLRALWVRLSSLSVGCPLTGFRSLFSGRRRGRSDEFGSGRVFVLVEDLLGHLEGLCLLHILEDIFLPFDQLVECLQIVFLARLKRDLLLALHTEVIQSIREAAGDVDQTKPAGDCCERIKNLAPEAVAL